MRRQRKRRGTDGVDLALGKQSGCLSSPLDGVCVRWGGWCTYACVCVCVWCNRRASSLCFASDSPRVSLTVLDEDLSSRSRQPTSTSRNPSHWRHWLKQHRPFNTHLSSGARWGIPDEGFEGGKLSMLSHSTASTSRTIA